MANSEIAENLTAANGSSVGSAMCPNSGGFPPSSIVVVLVNVVIVAVVAAVRYAAVRIIYCHSKSARPFVYSSGTLHGSTGRLARVWALEGELPARTLPGLGAALLFIYQAIYKHTHKYIHIYIPLTDAHRRNEYS